MSDIDKFVLALEQREQDEDMHFSLYSIPKYYLEEPPPYE